MIFMRHQRNGVLVSKLKFHQNLGINFSFLVSFQQLGLQFIFIFRVCKEQGENQSIPKLLI